MNVLILTPDAVGSTLLQRLLTIYMQFHQFDQPVINLHELTNGLSKFYSSDFNREIITRRGKWGYHQSLSEVVDMLQSVDHYKTARLAQYHIVQRQDSLADQLPFYQYIDENFYVIACRRQNLFEHAMSHAINAVSKKLNVYTAQEKLNSFYGLYRSGIEIQSEQIFSALDRYRDYLQWASCYFTVGSYFYYEQHLPEIEKYILNLPVFGEQKQRITWKQTFDMDFKDWNLCHYYKSDLGALALSSEDTLLRLVNTANSSPGTTAVSLLQDLLPTTHKSFLQTHGEQYVKVNDSIYTMQKLGILPSSVPIKKQTLSEKLHIVRNLQQCVDAFNHWAEQNPGIAEPISIDQLMSQAHTEYQNHWDSRLIAAEKPLVQISNQQ